MTKESSVARVLLVLVFAPSGGLFGKAVADAAAGREWWPWLVAALVWLVLSGLVSVAVTSRFEDQHDADQHAANQHGQGRHGEGRNRDSQDRHSRVRHPDRRSRDQRR